MSISYELYALSLAFTSGALFCKANCLYINFNVIDTL
jgi:hypothetical protein